MFKINLVNLPSPLKIKMDYKFPEVLPVKLQKKEVRPRTVSQLVYPDSGFNGLSEVNVEAVTNEIDENIKSENIKKDVSILGVQGNVEELKGTKLEITKNGTYTPEEPYNAFTEVEANVDVDTSEYFAETAITSSANSLLKKFPMFTITSNNMDNFFSNYSKLQTIPQLDTSKVTSMVNTFYNCHELQTIPQLDTSKVTSMYGTFYNCYKLQTIPQLDTSKVTNMSYMFSACYELQTIPQLDTSNVTNMINTFSSCAIITFIPQLDTSKVTSMGGMCTSCRLLESIPLLNASKVTNTQNFIGYCASLVNLGGLQNLGQAFDTTKAANFSNYTLGCNYANHLTHDSLMNVINNLYDIATKGVKTQRLVLGSTNIAKLTADEIAIATNKGWNVS